MRAARQLVLALLSVLAATAAAFAQQPGQDPSEARTPDSSGTYRLDAWEFTVGGDNMLDSYPDEVMYINTTNGQLPYSATSPNGFNGAFVYGKIGYRW